MCSGKTELQTRFSFGLDGWEGEGVGTAAMGKGEEKGAHLMEGGEEMRVLPLWWWREGGGGIYSCGLLHGCMHLMRIKMGE